MYHDLRTKYIEKVNTLLENREKIIFAPTPVHELRNISKILNGPRIFIKRDDMTGLSFGGSKIRKLEFLIKEVIENKNDVVITVGGLQSNCCYQTAAICALYKIECYLFLVGKREKYVSEGNILLNQILDTEIIFHETLSEAMEGIQILQNELKLKAKNPFFIPLGGSNINGNLGYTLAFKEILEDEKKINLQFDYIIFASSSLGTQAGLIIGNALFNNCKKKICGISTMRKLFGGLTPEKKIISFIKEFDTRHGTDIINYCNIKEEDIIYDQRFNEAGYAIMSEEDKKALDLFAKNEAILLDPVYSARAAAGMIKMIENGEISKNANILFIHTGGGPALFTNILSKK
jgi:L-cysteate sulfo-lyase